MLRILDNPVVSVLCIISPLLMMCPVIQSVVPVWYYKQGGLLHFLCCGDLSLAQIREELRGNFFKLIILTNVYDAILIFYSLMCAHYYMKITAIIVKYFNRLYNNLRFASLFDNFEEAIELENYEEIVEYLQKHYITALGKEDFRNLFKASELLTIFLYYGFEKLTPRTEREHQQRFNNTMSTFKLMMTNLKVIRELIKTKCREFIWFGFEHHLDKFLFLIELMMKVAKTRNEKAIVTQWVRNFVEQDFRTIDSELPFLELCIWPPQDLHYSVCPVGEENPPWFQKKFTRIMVLKFLLYCGAKVNAKDGLGKTMLYVATYDKIYEKEVIEALLEYGAHLDQVVNDNFCPMKRLQTREEWKNVFSSSLNLKCLCARTICIHKIPYENTLPKHLKRLVELHES